MDKLILEAMAAYTALGNTEEEFANLMYDAEFGQPGYKTTARINLRKLPNGADIISSFRNR